jgi:hypothetical protein
MRADAPRQFRARTTPTLLFVCCCLSVSGQTPAPSANKPLPRVFIEAASFGKQWNALRNQTIEMSTDFAQVCPTVTVTIYQQQADYTVILNHIEHGLLRDNQIEVADRNGDLLKTKEGGSIRGDAEQACALIRVDSDIPPVLPVLSAKNVYIDDKCDSGKTATKASADLRKWGRFQIVQDREHANLVFLFTEQKHNKDLAVLDPTNSETLWERSGGSETDVRYPNADTLIEDFKKTLAMWSALQNR